MKFVKLSLVAALAAGSFSALNAKPLEEAIKNVDVSGFARYRYDSGTWKDKSLPLNAGANGVNTIQNHRFRAAVGTTIDVGDGFKVVGQLMYNNDSNFGYAYGTNAQGTNTKSSPVLKLAYLQYANADFGYSAKLGRQQLNTIWTEDLTGMAAEAFYSPVDGFTLAAFAVDSIEGAKETGGTGADAWTGWQVGDTDATNFQAYLGKNAIASGLTQRLYKYNLYGAAAIVSSPMADLQLWGAYWQDTANLWAAQVKFKLPVAEGLNYNLRGTYLGNTVDDDLKAVGAKNGALYDLRGSLEPTEGEGFDAKLGGIMFGKKDGFTVNTLEGMSGAKLLAGKEIFYQKGSWLALAYGQNTYGYVGAGYTFNGVRLGVEGVYGGTKSEVQNAIFGTGTKMELVGELGWKVNKNLDFSVWYSNLTTKAKHQTKDDDKSVKDSVRFQAYYKF